MMVVCILYFHICVQSLFIIEHLFTCNDVFMKIENTNANHRIIIIIIIIINNNNNNNNNKKKKKKKNGKYRIEMKITRFK